MPDESNKNNTSVEGSEPPANQQTPPPPVQAAPLAPHTPQTPASPPSNANGKVVPMTPQAFAEYRKQERDKGAKAVRDQLDRDARQRGFKDHADLMAHAERSRQPQQPRNPQPQPQRNAMPQQPQNNNRRDDRNNRRNKNRGGSQIDTRLSHLESEKLRLTKQFNGSERKRKSLQREIDALKAEQVLREAAIRVGIVDVDYAVHLLKKDNAGKTADQLQGFDEVKYFQGLRDRYPQIFNVEERPANSGNNATPAAPPPAQSQGATPPPAAPPTKKGDDPPAVDARKMTPAAVDARLRELGVNPNAPS